MNKIEIDLDTITKELDQIKDDMARYKFELGKLEKEKEKRVIQLTALLGQMDVKSMDYGAYTFGWKEYKRTAFDQQLFKREQPELFQKYYIPKVTERFEFKIKG